MEFSVVRKTIGGMFLLKSGDAGAIARPLPVFVGRGKEKVGKVVETIARVQNPYYLAVLEKEFEEKFGEKLAGMTLTAPQERR